MRLLSCPLNRGCLARLVPHRRFSFALLNFTLTFAAIRCSAKAESSGMPCTLPRSSTGWCGCLRAALEPSRRIFPSELRRIVTGIRAWSDRAMTRSATGKMSCFPSSLVCTSPHPPRRSSLFKSCPSPQRKAASGLLSFRSCVGAQKLAILDYRPRGDVRFDGSWIADVDGAIASHSVYDHRQFARHGDRGLVMAAPFHVLCPHVLTLSLPLKRVSIADTPS